MDPNHNPVEQDPVELGKPILMGKLQIFIDKFSATAAARDLNLNLVQGTAQENRLFEHGLFFDF